MTTTLTKRAVIGPVNGTDQLFQLPDTYLEGTLWTFVVAPDLTITHFLQPTFFAGGFFQITTAPVVNSLVYCIYDIAVTSPADPANFDLNGVTIQNILDIATVLQTQQTLLDNLNKAILNRVSTTDFDKFAETFDTKLKTIAINHIIS
jgi:hypothetical protein